MSIEYLKTAVRASRDNAGEAILNRTISDLILGLDMASDRIPPDDLGGANEAIVAINAAVKFLDELRGA